MEQKLSDRLWRVTGAGQEWSEVGGKLKPVHTISVEFNFLSGIYGKALIKIMEHIVFHRVLIVFLGTYTSIVHLPDRVHWFQREGNE